MGNLVELHRDTEITGGVPPSGASALGAEIVMRPADVCKMLYPVLNTLAQLVKVPVTGSVGRAAI
jgi:hypothetical protein